MRSFKFRLHVLLLKACNLHYVKQPYSDNDALAQPVGRSYSLRPNIEQQSLKDLKQGIDSAL